MRSSAFAAVFLLPTTFAACGARSALSPGEHGASTGGASSSTPTASTTTTTTTSSTTATSSTGSGGTSALCTSWQLVPPIVTRPASRGGEPSRTADDETLLVTFVEAPPGDTGILRADRLRTFAQWPPLLLSADTVATDVRDYVSGEGVAGPVALLAGGDGQLRLATTLLPTAVSMPQQTPGTLPLFVAGIADRWLYAAWQQLPNYAHYDVGSFQTGGLEQNESPHACVYSWPRGGAVPIGQGFVAAYSLSDPPQDDCDVMSPKNGGVATLYRYDAPAEPGSFLAMSAGDTIVFPSSLMDLLLVRTPSGGWMVMQSDFVPGDKQPAARAARFDAGAHLVPAGTQGFAVAPEGVGHDILAAAPLDEGLIVAWGEYGFPPTLSLRTVGPDGSLGPIASFDTGPAPLRGRLRVIAGRSLRSLVATWDSDANGAGLARLDCAD
jgi:hypothetical protein